MVPTTVLRPTVVPYNAINLLCDAIRLNTPLNVIINVCYTLLFIDINSPKLNDIYFISCGNIEA